MKRSIVRNVFTIDHSVRHTSDRLLAAVPVGKTLVAGTLWEGDLQPRIDNLKDELKELVTGFTIGQTLDPEGPGRQIDIGRVWKGISELENAVRDARVALAVAQGASTTDARSRVRDTPAVVGSFSKPTSPSTVNQINREFWRRQTTADHSSAAASPSSTPNTITSINEANRKFWAERS